MANILSVICAGLLIGAAGYAADLGVHGTLYPISELDIRDYISTEARKYPEEQLQNALMRSLTEPRPVRRVGEARNVIERSFDPTVELTTDVTDADGKVIIPPGQCFNPLQSVSLSQALLFIDGSRQDHIDWAMEHGESCKWILVRGKPLDLEGRLRRPIYFDQYGALCTRLGIQNVPALVWQDSLVLRIREEPVAGGTR